LGLALASGAPPIAGVIASIVGGMVVAIIGGSNVAIVGPGNGLVVVTLAAITTLGAGDMYQGYLFTLAAVVLSGAVIFLLGLLRFGALSEFFPSAAVQGMLAAIGLIIMAKQIHLMLGVNNPDATGAIALLLEVPASLALVFKGNVPAFSYIFG
jgi:MFS superfamily sulfate permease-like transporter